MEEEMASDGFKAKKAILLGLDGADPMMMRRLLGEGKLPNIKKVIEMGTTTESLSMLGEHPAMTPPNWASLANGARTGTHGITCFWNHTSGQDLLKLQYAFNSRLSKAEFIWDAAARIGKKSILFNYPTAWPSTSKEHTIAVDGSMIIPNTRTRVANETIYSCEEGDFRVEFVPVKASYTGDGCIVDGQVDERDFEVSEGDVIATRTAGGEAVKALEVKKEGDDAKRSRGRHDRVSAPIKPATGWRRETGSAKEFDMPVNGGQLRRYGLIIAEDGKRYNKVEIYKNKQEEKPIGEARVGQWSDWIYDEYETYDEFKMEDKNAPVAYKVKVIDLEEDGSKLRLYSSYAMDQSNQIWVHPQGVGRELYEKIGPMMHQSLCAIHDVMAETQAEMYDWYARAVKYLMDNHEWALFYVHVHALDIANHIYQNTILEEHSPDYQRNFELLCRYYEISDRFVGEILNHIDDDTLLIIASDHGGMSREPGCEPPMLGDPHAVAGKVMEDLGYMVVDREKSPPEIIWEKTRAISQRSGYIYINLKGREPHGIVEPEDYDDLVEKIIDDLLCLKDPGNGRRPICLALKKEDMPVLGLYGDHVGDIYFTYNPSWTRVHGTQLTTSSYKGTSVGCLFIIAGPGIRKGETIKRLVNVIDIVPTICHLTGIPIPREAEGGIIYQALEGQ